MDDRRTDTHELTSTPDSPETAASHASPDALRGSIPGDSSSNTSYASDAFYTSDSSDASDTPTHIHEFPRPVPSITNSPGCTPARMSVSPRRVRPVRVDAWAVPASVSWTRTRMTLRKVSRHSHATDWALPF